MLAPLISVVIPVRNEAARLAATIRSITQNRSSEFILEIVIHDDASNDDCCIDLARNLSSLKAPNTAIKVMRSGSQRGVPISRNIAASLATAEVLFITDAHVQFCPNWDRIILNHLAENRILAATIADPDSAFQGYGCRLVVPFMGTYWNKKPLASASPVQVAACIGTVLHRELFHKMQGYDAGMRLYGAAEPEFSVRAWLSGFEIMCVPELKLLHRFKPAQERDSFVSKMRPFMVHNSLRFGLLYLSDAACMQMIRYYSLKFPIQIRQAIGMLANSDVWARRTWLRSALPRNFDWFIERFDVRDDLGRRLP